MKKFYQQGDVLLTVVDGIPENSKKLDHVTLARGEASGHHHTITAGEAECYEVGSTWYLKVLSDEAILTHQEHKPIPLPTGIYEIGIVQEYDHFAEEARQVTD